MLCNYCGLHLHKSIILTDHPATHPDLHHEQWQGDIMGKLCRAVNNGKLLSSVQLTFWQPPANSILIH